MGGQVAAPVAAQPASAAQPAAGSQVAPTPAQPTQAQAASRLLGGFPDLSSIASVDELLDLGESAAALVGRFVPHTAPKRS